jgi:aminoglycoside phosphotransferase (APT) family kinase protein
MIDADRLADWMDGMGLAGKGEPLDTRFISGGTQNEIYEIRRGELHCALRIPPPEAPAPRDEGINREWRIIAALEGTDVPHTAAVAACDDPSVLGRTFYLMGFVDGWSPMDTSRVWPAPFDTDLDARAGLAYQLAEGIALLSRVDWRARGLEGLGRPDGFHERQVDRWTSFFERIKGRELDGIDEASAWLRAHEPIDYVPGIMHGDYQFANVMYHHGAPARLAAIVDWEMGTVGDPSSTWAGWS